MSDPNAKRFTLREYIALHAYAALLSLPAKEKIGCPHHKAKIAVSCADALIEELNQEPEAPQEEGNALRRA
jgi:hypothetical protein